MNLLYKIKNKFFGLWKTTESTGQQVVRGTALSFIEKIVTKLLLFMRTAVLARLLFPGDFGLFGLAALAMGMTEAVIVRPGFEDALVYERKGWRKYMDITWTVRIIRGLIIAVLMFFVIAPLAANFFANEKVFLLVRVLAIVIILDSIGNIGVIMFSKELMFNKKFFYNVLSTVFRVIVVIIAAWFLRNVWALVIGSIAGSLAYAVLSYWLHPFRPRFFLDKESFSYLFRFGKWVAFSGLITFLVTRGDSLTIGKLLDEESLGFYSLALGLGALPAMEVVRSLSGVLFPLYSKIQKDYERLKNIFIKVLRMVLAFVIPASVGMIVLAPQIISSVYGSRWLPMISALYVIVLFGLLKSFEFISKPLFMGIGKPKLATIVTIIQAVVMYSVIVPLTYKYGIMGAALAVTVGSLAGQLFFIFKLRKELNIGLRVYPKISFIPLLSSIIMFIFIYGLKLLIHISDWYILAWFILFGAGVYFIFLMLFDKLFGGEFYKSFTWIKKNL